MIETWVDSSFSVLQAILQWTSLTVLNISVHYYQYTYRIIPRNDTKRLSQASGEAASHSLTSSTNSGYSLPIFLVYTNILDENGMSFSLVSLLLKMFINNLHFFVKYVAHFSTRLFLSLFFFFFAIFSSYLSVFGHIYCKYLL